LIISHDKVGPAMAGPGIRYHYMAEVLSKSFDVVVGFYDKSYLPEQNFKRSYEVRHIDAYYFESGFEGVDIVISHWLTPQMIRYCNINKIFLVFDLYVPGPIENLAGSLFGGKSVKPEDDAAYDHTLEMYHIFFEYGDLFLFSNNRQLDFWTGYAFGAKTIHLSSYKKRQIYDRFIYAPMGIDLSTPLDHNKSVLKGVIEGVDKDDSVLLWTGGIWGHFDGLVLIKAMARLYKKYPHIKLVFFGTQHPNPSIPEMKESLDTRLLAKKLGVINKNVFFLDGWVKYNDRINYLLEADVAINTHKESIETEFSHRTRVLDHLLAGLPTISTKGDYLSDSVIEPLDLGIVVPPNDEVAVAEAIVKILEPKRYKQVRNNVLNARASFDWDITMSNLKKSLLSEHDKLVVLDDAHDLKEAGSLHRMARKIVPVPIKKMVVRSLKVAGLR